MGYVWKQPYNYITSMQETPKVGERLASMLLDHFFMTIILSFFMIPIIVLNIDPLENRISLFSPLDYFLMIAMVVIYALKDVFNGRSLAKRIIKLQVVDAKTGAVASPIKCFLRNLLIPIWPIEVIVTLFNPQQRLGDRLAGTKIISIRDKFINNSITPFPSQNH